LRPGCGLARIDAALGALNNLKRRHGARNPRVHIAFLLLRSNWRELGGVVDLAARWEAAQIVVSQMAWLGDTASQAESLLPDPDLLPEVSRALERAGEKASARGIGFCHHGAGVGRHRAACPENSLKACFVSHRGDVSPCVFTGFSLSPEARATHLFDGRTHEVREFVFGNVREQPLPEIWNSSRARLFRQSFRNRVEAGVAGGACLPEPCRRCDKLREPPEQPAGPV
jgi:MoaA/NifB/PqqE/SkfB family radical SAM enzyme